MIFKDSWRVVKIFASTQNYNKQLYNQSSNEEVLEIVCPRLINISPGGMEPIWVTVRNLIELPVSNIRIAMIEITRPLTLLGVNPNSVNLMPRELTNFRIDVFAPSGSPEGQYSIIFRVICQSPYIIEPPSYLSLPEETITILTRPAYRWYIA